MFLADDGIRYPSLKLARYITLYWLEEGRVGYLTSKNAATNVLNSEIITENVIKQECNNRNKKRDEKVSLIAIYLQILIFFDKFKIEHSLP